MENWGWIALTLFAVLMQSVRTAGQRQLTKHVDAMGATMVRFVFGLPFALIYLGLVMHWQGVSLPPFNQDFIVFTSIAAVLQIIATVLLVYLFSLRNFAVGITYARIEAVLTAIIGSMFFGELIGGGVWLAVIVSVAGVMMLSVARSSDVDGARLINKLWSKSTLVGVSSGLAFAICSLSLRRASLSFGSDDYLFTAGLVLVSTILIQCVLTVGYMAFRSAHQFPVVIKQWRLSLFVGVTSALGSIGWFIAMTLERATYVKALGQIEFLLALAISFFFFKERTSRLELVGMVLVAAGIVLLLVYG
jgi:drug/metabolite transporter (DMT)-like permease